MRVIRIVFLSAILLSVIFFIFSTEKGIERKEKRVEKGSEVSQNQPREGLAYSDRKNEKKERSCVALPYWINLGRVEGLEGREVFYFGIAFDSAGNILKDEGWRKIDAVLKQIDTKPYLIVRMVDSKQNAEILSDKNLREKIIEQTLEFTTSSGGFAGVVLNLEFSPIFYNFLQEKINLFVKKFYEDAKDAGVRFELILQADSFYRNRPFDIQFLSSQADYFWLMAYDFSKKDGEPGPNFPLFGKEKFGYDLVSAVEDFSRYIAPEKMGVFFGMYGYEWVVDEEKRPIRRAKALTVRQINERYVVNCKPENCSLTIDPLAKEKEINFVLSEWSEDLNQYIIYPRIIYFDDQETVEIKKQELKKRGINGFCLWAYGYY